MRCVRTQIAYFLMGLIVAHPTHLKRPVGLKTAKTVHLHLHLDNQSRHSVPIF